MVARNVWFSHLQKAPSQAQVGIFTEAKQNSAAAHWAGKFKKRAERAVIRFLRDLAEIGSFSWKIKIMRPTQIQEHLVLVNLKNLPLLFDVTWGNFFIHNIFFLTFPARF